MERSNEFKEKLLYYDKNSEKIFLIYFHDYSYSDIDYLNDFDLNYFKENNYDYNSIDEINNYIIDNKNKIKGEYDNQLKKLNITIGNLNFSLTKDSSRCKDFYHILSKIFINKLYFLNYNE